MKTGWMRTPAVRCAVSGILIVLSLGGNGIAQAQKDAAKPEIVQKPDEEYTAKIKEHTQENQEQSMKAKSVLP